MHIDKLYLMIGLEILFVYFVVTIILVRSSKIFNLIQNIFNEIKQNKEEELIRSNQVSLTKIIELKKMTLRIMRSNKQSHPKEIARILNTILDKNQFSENNFNYFEKEHYNVNESLKSYKNLYSSSELKFKNMIIESNSKLDNLKILHKNIINRHKEQNQNLNNELVSIKDSTIDSKEVEFYVEKITDLESDILRLNNLIKEYEMSQEILEYEIQQEKDKNIKNDDDNEYDIEADINVDGINIELSDMIEKLILDQEALISKINEQDIIISNNEN